MAMARGTRTRTHGCLPRRMVLCAVAFAIMMAALLSGDSCVSAQDEPQSVVSAVADVAGAVHAFKELGAAASAANDTEEDPTAKKAVASNAEAGGSGSKSDADGVEPAAAAKGDKDGSQAVDDAGSGSGEVEEGEDGDAQEETPAPAPTQMGVDAGWKPVNKDEDLSEDFFSSESENEATGGSMYFSFCTIRDGLPKPAYLGINNNKLIESVNLRSMERFILKYPGKKKVLIFHAKSKSYWKLNTETRTIEFAADMKSATHFELLTNAKKDLVILKADNLYLRTTHGKQGEPVSFSPALVSRSFFRTWASAVDMKPEEMVKERQLMQTSVLDVRRKATVANPAYVAYDLALALLMEKDFDAFPLENANGLDLAVVIDDATSLVATSSLVDEYKEKYKSFGKGLPEDFDLFTWSAVVKTQGAMPWQEMINAIQQMPRTVESPLHNNFQTIALTTFQAADANSGEAMTVFNGPLIYQAHFAASCNLAWLARDGMENVTLAQLVEDTQLPKIEQEDVAIAHLVPLKDKHEEYWFTGYLQSNFSSLNYSATSIFPEIALLKHLQPQWVSQHSWIGEGITKHFTKRVDAALEAYEIAKIIDLFAPKERAAREILQTALLYCKPMTRISFCVIPYLYQMARASAGFTALQSRRQMPLDMRGISNVDLQEYMKVHKSETLLTKQITNILAMKKEAMMLSDQMFSEVAEKMEAGQLDTMVKANKQLREDAAASYEQVRNSSQFAMEAAQTVVDTKFQIATDAYKAAMAVQDPYLENMKELGDVALDEAVRASFFEATRTAVSMASGVQTMMNPQGMMDVVNTATSVKSQFAKMDAKLSKVGGANKLIQTLKESLPMMENISVEIANKLPEIDRIRAIALPILSAEDKSKLTNETDGLSDAATKLKDFNLGTRINRLSAYFGQLASQMCAIIARPGFKPCVTVMGYNNDFFGNIQASVEASNDALGALGDIASGAADTQAADASYQAIAGHANETAGSLEDLREEYDNNKDTQLATLFQMRKQQDTDAAFATSLAFQSQTTFLQLMYLMCARLTLSNGGVAIPICESKVMQFKPLTSQEINTLLAFESEFVAPPRRVTALLPTQPQFPGDTGFIDLARLMNGQPVVFRLPQNATWLSQFGWITNPAELNRSMITVEKFKMVLPPRYADDEEEVTIEVQAQGIADLGPAMARLRYVLLAPSKFIINYSTEQQCSGVPLATNPYDACGVELKELCFQQEGISEAVEQGGQLPPLFSEFVATATFDSSVSAPRPLAYRALATPSVVRVYTELVVTTPGSKTTPGSETTEEDDEEEERRRLSAVLGRKVSPQRRSHRRSLREAVMAAVPKKARCCEVGKYMVNWSGPKGKKSVCHACPDGSVSQMGGMFCMYAQAGGAAEEEGEGEAGGEGEGEAAEGEEEA